MNNTQLLTLGEVTKRFQIGKATLSRDRAKGLFSAEKRPDGSYRVSVSELLRCYGDRLKPRNGRNSSDTSTLEQSTTPKGTPDNRALEAKLDAAERLLQERAETIDDLRERLTKADEERTRLTILLTDQRQKESHGFWSRLLGKS